MRFTHLRSFHAVALEGSVTAAVHQLKRSQSTISIQIKSLEQDFGVELFHRHARRLELTDFGRLLLVMTRRLFALEAEITEFLEAGRELKSGQLKVSAVGPSYVMPILAAFRQTYNGVSVSVNTANSEAVLEDVLEYRADIGIVVHVPADLRLESRAFGPNRIVLFFHRHHPWATRRHARLRDLEGQEMVLREPSSASRRAFEAALKQSRVHPRVIMEVNSREAMREAVAAGIGMGVVSETALGSDDRFRSLPFHDTKIFTHTHVAWLRERRNALVIKAFLQIVDKLATNW